MGAQSPRASRNRRYVSEEEAQAAFAQFIEKERARIRDALRPGVEAVSPDAEDAAEEGKNR